MNGAVFILYTYLCVLLLHLVEVLFLGSEQRHEFLDLALGAVNVQRENLRGGGEGVRGTFVLVVYLVNSS